jgi:Fe-S-cluster containining protein
MDECIGCGFCCRKSPCSFVHEEITDLYQIDFDVLDRTQDTVRKNSSWSGCPHLQWDGARWVCGKYVEEQDPRWKAYMAHTLAFGEGCCSSLNTYRRKCHVPTPEELKDEKALLDRLHHLKG